MPTTGQTPEVTVLGAGVVGMATAWAAARRGLSVELIDRAAGPARGASFANGAQLSYAYTDAMAGPSLWKQIPALLSGSDPAFRIRLRGDPSIWRWGLSLLSHASRARMQRNTLSTLALARASQQAMAGLLDRHPIQFQHRTAGKLHLYFSDPALRAGARMVELKRAHGVRQTLLDAEGARQVEPALQQVAGIRGAVYSPDEAVGDPWRFACGLLETLCRDYPVSTRFGFDLETLQRSGRHWLLRSREGEAVEARRLIVCTGIDSAALLRPLGIRLPLMAIKGYSFTAPCGPQAPATSITDTSRKIVFCRLGEHIRVAGLADINDWDPGIDQGRFERLVALARQSLPGAADYARIRDPWAGLRPSTPASVPVIANVREGLTCNVGHGMLGWTLAMGSGERAVALALGEEAA
ncbi:FAD-dependent oxidoreductase [Luteimonas wenzhouensis]|uniref:FAD-dependent oxidoreductase n=1 Tax=Luteimonas wenzhouensis TaxID=2599615 RepID=A0A5C5U097_9GAMM|nr:FAD-dependent oxidoreductase [Luteimonas wenzhouensis]TWT18992.1 FAD-dependent oxidoreductase [Luteimonas wenzhouensis]